MDIKLNNLNKTIINCKKCPRLVKFIKKISTEKRKQNINEIYWGKPVPGFGNLESKLAIIGLAPAAHGGTRTGRAFTGDKSGDFLFKCLHEVGISNSPISKNINDNLELKSTYITNILKCVPPEDKPLNNEILNCSSFFDEEILNLKKLKVIVTLGKVAFDNCTKLYKQKFYIKKKFTFKHGKTQLLPNGIIILSSYHPSPRNVNTKLVTNKMMVNLFKKAKKLAKF
ncbi:uracil-DNA glycosylase [Candidatus Pelagibacter communis]|jgi:uracil-DNA glycosylase family 4|uniref:uracil-DNA glycosylase n=1 Tax=Pelagibacter ubique TaxID=198252 RepID=UPI00094CEA4A|nr:uracil-DNA glycosylase [Candidatus Pelagibacter ubique]